MCVCVHAFLCPMYENSSRKVNWHSITSNMHILKDINTERGTFKVAGPERMQACLILKSKVWVCPLRAQESICLKNSNKRRAIPMDSDLVCVCVCGGEGGCVSACVCVYSQRAMLCTVQDHITQALLCVSVGSLCIVREAHVKELFVSHDLHRQTQRYRVSDPQVSTAE